MKKKLLIFALFLTASIPAFAVQKPVGGITTITTSGTAVKVLSTAGVYYKSMTVCAALANTGVVYTGDSTVLASSKNGIPLNAGDCISYDAPGDLGIPANHWVDSTVSGDKVNYEYIDQV